jgi:hypothetical protein
LSAAWCLLSALCSLSAVCCLLSALCSLSAVCCLLTALCSLSAVCYLLPAVCCPLPAVCCLLSTVFCPLAADPKRHNIPFRTMLRMSISSNGARERSWMATPLHCPSNWPVACYTRYFPLMDMLYMLQANVCACVRSIVDGDPASPPFQLACSMLDPVHPSN